jgi:hypothetical protein
MFDGWVEALRTLGEEVYTFNLDRRLSFYDSALIAEDITTVDGRKAIHKALSHEQAVTLAAEGILSAAYRTWPDVILLVSAFFTPPDLLDMMRGRGHKVVLLHSESPYQDEEQLVRAAHADLNLLNDPVNIAAYRDLGVPAQYMPHAYRPKVHYPAAGAQKLWDLAFVGTGFPSRMRFFSQMDMRGLEVKLAGPWLDLPQDSPLRDWTSPTQEACLDNAETAQVYRQARAGINFYRREGEDGAAAGVAMGPREVEMAACGLFFLRDPRPEGDGLFPMLPAYTSPQEAGEQLRWWLAHDDSRGEAACKAREAVAGRTFENNARALLAMLGN